MKIILSKILRLWLVAAMLSVGSAPVALAKSKGKATFNMDLKNVSIEDLVRTMSKLTGKNFLLDSKVSGTVTLIAPTPVNVDEAWRIFLTVLSVRNLALERSGKVYKIVVAREAVQYNMPIIYGRTPHKNDDSMIVRMVPLEHMSVAELEAFLKNFKGKNGAIYTFASANMLVMVDTSNNINRILRLIERLDKPSVASSMKVMEVKDASATEIVKLITSVFGLGKSKATRRKKNQVDTERDFSTRAIADDRTNSIILLGPENEIKEISAFVTQFDRPVPAGTGQIHVYYLKNADATDLADTLGRLTQGAGQTKSKKAAAAASVAQFEGGIKITADKDTNSLIIISNPTDFVKLSELIQRLDRPRQQVYVEAAVVEVALGNNFEFSMGVAGGKEQKMLGEEGFAFGGLALGGSGVGLDPTALASLNGVLVGALKTNDSINILSTPHLLTSDNQEAEIVVGDNVPFITGQSTTSGGNVLTSVERRDVGLTLRITPQINESDRIKLELYQEISSVSSQQPSGVDVNQQGLVTRKRSAKTTVVASDRETIVIGGLISNEESQAISKVPLLGDIPILGRLFRSKKTQKRKTNLLIFLTPRIVRSQEDYDRYALKRSHQFWNLHQIAPADVGFADYFEQNLSGWGGEDVGTHRSDPYDGAAVDLSESEGMFIGTEEDITASTNNGLETTAPETNIGTANQVSDSTFADQTTSTP